MTKQHFNPRKLFSSLVISAVTVAQIFSQQAQAAIATPAVQAQKANPAFSTQLILDEASVFALQGATAIQKIQTLSMDSMTSSLLKDYMSSMIYIPQAMALPTDEEALDEPWAAAFISPMTFPNRDPKLLQGDEPVDAKAIDFSDNAPAAAKDLKTYLTLLKPVQNALLSSPFGFRWGRPHQGIDLSAPIGTAIVSAEDGRVVYSGWKQGYGNFVAVDHGHGYETHYAHCSKILVHTGQKVDKGQLIAKVGSTGHSTGPHLHFEVVANGVHRNPIKYLNTRLSFAD